MNNNYVEKVEKDIQFIKEVIESTSNSIARLSKTFIFLGFIILGASIINFLSHFMVSTSFFSITSIVFVILVIASLILLFYKIYKTPLMGVGKQIVNIWICIFIFFIISGLLNNAILPNIFNMHNADNFHISTSIECIAYSFGFLCIGIFTNFKVIRLLALLYAIIGLFFLLPNPLTSVEFLSANPNYIHLSEIIDYGVSFLIPLTFLFVGFFIQRKKTGE